MEQDTTVHAQSDEALSCMKDHLESFERDRRDLELIIFGLSNVLDGEMLDALLLVASHLGTVVMAAEVNNIFKIRGCTPSSCVLLR